MADEIHCYATIYCKKQHADDVKKALKDLDLYVARGSVFVTDAAKRLRSIGYAQAEISKILSAIG